MEYQRENSVIIAHVSSYSTLCLEESSSSSSSSSSSRSSFVQIQEEEENYSSSSFSPIPLKEDKTSNDNNSMNFSTTCITTNANSYSEFKHFLETKDQALTCNINENIYIIE